MIFGGGGGDLKRVFSLNFFFTYYLFVVLFVVCQFPSEAAGSLFETIIGRNYHYSYKAADVSFS